MLRLISLLLAGAILLPANISPGQVPIETRFRDSDLVCRGSVVSVDLLSNQVVLLNGRMVPQDYSIQLSTTRYYKGQPKGPQIQLILAQQPSPPTFTGIELLLFLKKQDNRNDQFVLAEPSGALVVVGKMPVPIAPPMIGPGGLEADLDFAATLVSLDTLRDVLDLLLYFSKISDNTQSMLLEKTNNADPRVRILSLELLSKSDPTTYLLDLAEAVQSSSLPDPPGIESLCDTLANRAGGNDLRALESFVKSLYSALRINAMLGIRRLKPAKEVAFLVDELGAPDPMVRYEAVITLSEITGLNGDFGPGLGPFNRDPGRYASLWKQWWLGADSQFFKNIPG